MTNWRGPMKSRRAVVADENGVAPHAFECRDRVRWADVDQAGIIYFGAYSRFVDVAECEFYRSLGFTFERFRELGILLPRVHLEFDFFHPALLDDVMVLRTRVAGVGVHSVRLAIDAERDSDGAPLAEATMVTACMGADRKSAPLPDVFAAALRARMAGA